MYAICSPSFEVAITTIWKDNKISNSGHFWRTSFVLDMMAVGRYQVGGPRLISVLYQAQENGNALQWLKFYKQDTLAR